MAGEDILEFGGFRLFPGERLLSHNDRPIRLGGRAMDILHCLIRKAGTVVSNQELIRSVWGAIHVEEVSLRVHISELRRVLAQVADADRCIVNIPGRGYTFTGVVEHIPKETLPHPVETSQIAGDLDALPPLPPRLLGRDEDVRRIRQMLVKKRFVSIVGTGGIGKTTLALAVAENAATEFADPARFIDLAPVRDPRMVTGAIAAALGLPVRSDDETASIVSFLETARMLLILDNCEHVIHPVAALAEKIFAMAPQVHILATTREPLRAKGEQVVRLGGLAVPPEDEAMPASAISAYPSVALFMERARSQAQEFELTEENAALVAQICRRLDGLALAIELAAGQVATFGVTVLAGSLRQHLNILTHGRRTAHPRQHAIRQTLDWSHDLLNEKEKHVFQRLSVFAGSFSLDAAETVASDAGIPDREIAGLLSDLVEKSLVSADITNDVLRFRLLETTREYASEKLNGSREASVFRHRHAAYFLSVIEAEIRQRPNQTIAHMRPDIDNLRAALAWSLSDVGNAAIAMPLTIAAADLMTDLSLLSESTKWAAQALERLPDALRGSHAEMALLTHFAMPLLFLHGNSDKVGQALDRALELAHALKDTGYWQVTISALFAFHLRAGHLAGLRETIARAESMASGMEDTGMLDCMKSIVAFFSSDLAGNYHHAKRALSLLPQRRSHNLLRIGVDHRIWTYTSHVLALWIRGHRNQAREMAQRMVEEGEALASPVPLATALVWAGVLSLWAGDIEVAERRTLRLLECATRNALLPYRLVAEGHGGTIAVLKGEVGKGIDQLERSVAKLVETGSRVQEILLLSQLTQAYAAAKRYGDARALVEAGLSRALRTGSHVNRADFMRLRALYRWHEDGDEGACIAGLEDALRQAREDGILTCELRVLVLLASLEGNPAVSARALGGLRDVHAQFTEALDSPDLVAARHLLEKASSSGTPC